MKMNPINKTNADSIRLVEEASGTKQNCADLPKDDTKFCIDNFHCVLVVYTILLLVLILAGMITVLAFLL
jgi:hypothetical protein